MQGKEWSPRFTDQLTKLQLWSLVQYDWVLYADSDILMIRSYVPCIHFVLSQPHPSKIAAVSVPTEPESFNGGLFMLQPSEDEYQTLLCSLHGTKNNNKVPANKCKAIRFAEEWMEQGDSCHPCKCIFAQIKYQVLTLPR